MDTEMNELFAGLQQIQKADEVIKEIAVRQNTSWGDLVRQYFRQSCSLSRLDRIQFRNTIETLEHIENVINEIESE